MITNNSTNVSSSISFNNGLKKNNVDGFKLNYSPFLGGLNTTHAALAQYDPLRTGRARLFMVRTPKFMDNYLQEHNMGNMTDMVRHMFEYGFTKVDGLGDIELQFNDISGGYTSKKLETATMAEDGTSSLTIGLYEWSGSPMSEYLQLWLTGISDPETGFGTYHGAKTVDAQGNTTNTFLPYRQDNHTAEFIYCVTDPTGRSDALEYACLFTNCIIKRVKKDHFNFQKATSDIVELDAEFTTNKYESPDINYIASRLVAKHNVLKDSLNFKSGYAFGSMANYTDLSVRKDQITGITNPDASEQSEAADANWSNVRGSNTVGAEDKGAWDWT